MINVFYGAVQVAPVVAGEAGLGVVRALMRLRQPALSGAALRLVQSWW